MMKMSQNRLKKSIFQIAQIGALDGDAFGACPTTWLNAYFDEIRADGGEVSNVSTDSCFAKN